tara:strand:+ start:75 stop:389 length:315 start_codon:yes stop_codon:yes gene_type:complete
MSQVEDIYDVDHDAEYGKAFRYVYTPTDKESNPDGGSISIVTPENEDAWFDWEPLSVSDALMMRSRWMYAKKGNTLEEHIAPHKAEQILRARKFWAGNKSKSPY